MKILQFIIINLFLCLITSITAEEYKTFTNNKGQSIKAKLVSYDYDTNKVTIEREDQQQATVSPSIFGDEDRTYIERWIFEYRKTSGHHSITVDEEPTVSTTNKVLNVNYGKRVDYQKNLSLQYPDFTVTVIESGTILAKCHNSHVPYRIFRIVTKSEQFDIMFAQGCIYSMLPVIADGKVYEIDPVLPPDHNVRRNSLIVWDLSTNEEHRSEFRDMTLEKVRSRIELIRTDFEK